MGDMEAKKLKNKYSFQEVSKILKLKDEELKEFEDEGIFEFCDKTKTQVDHYNFERLKTAVSLKKEIGVNTPGIDIILNMKEKMSSIQSEFQYFMKSVRHRMGEQLHDDLKKIEENLKKH